MIRQRFGTDLLRYRAGPRAPRRLRRDGLATGSIRAVFGPASGPRWRVLAGLDRALLDSDSLSPQPVANQRILLAGSCRTGRRWRNVAATSQALGEQLLRDLESGRIADRVAPMTPL